MSWCKTCGEYRISMFSGRDEHVCPPVWVVWCPEHGEDRHDGREIRARSSGGAAEIWAELVDAHGAEYAIVGGRDEPIVCVEASDGELVRYQLYGESVPSYRAHLRATKNHDSGALAERS